MTRKQEINSRPRTAKTGDRGRGWERRPWQEPQKRSHTPRRLPSTPWACTFTHKDEATGLGCAARTGTRFLPSLAKDGVQRQRQVLPLEVGEVMAKENPNTAHQREHSGGRVGSQGTWLHRCDKLGGHPRGWGQRGVQQEMWPPKSDRERDTWTRTQHRGLSTSCPQPCLQVSIRVHTCDYLAPPHPRQGGRAQCSSKRGEVSGTGGPKYRRCLCPWHPRLSIHNHSVSTLTHTCLHSIQARPRHVRAVSTPAHACPFPGGDTLQGNSCCQLSPWAVRLLPTGWGPRASSCSLPHSRRPVAGAATSLCVCFQ